MIEHTWSGATADVFGLTDDSSAVVLINEGIEGMGMPPLDSFTRETALLDGQTNTGWRAKPREVFWPIMITSDVVNWQGEQAAWWATMRPNLFGDWTVTTNGQARHLRCRFVDDGGAQYASDPSREGAEVHGITLVADDPWWRGAEISKTFQTAETPEPFYAVTTDRVFNLMSSNTVANTTITNPGDVPVWLTHRFDGPLTSFVIGYSTLDGLPVRNVSAPLTLASGEWAILDTSPTKQTLTKFTSGGAVSDDVTYLLEAAAWAQVDPGENQPISVELNGSGSLTTSLTPQYFRAF